jgi:predicted HD phosphohydrolase
MTNLYPAAQSVLDAYYTEADRLDREVSHEEMLAAALRAAANGCDPDWLALTVLHHLHSIANELEAQ